MTDQKYVYASPEWIECAGRILQDMAREYGEEGQSFSFCEILMDAPGEFADAEGCACWTVNVDGKNVQSIPERGEDTDLVLQGTWEIGLLGARTVYTPEYIAEQEKNPTPPPEDPNREVRGDMTKLPAWIGEFHNRVAVVTA